MIVTLSTILAYAALASAGPVLRPRVVQELNQDAFEEAQQRDGTATRAFSGVQIKTSGNKCLSVDKLSGDFRANLTPIQVVDCGSTDGEGWDIITAGKHIDQSNAMLVVSTLTQACFNFDPRRAAGNQVLLFSCGGRADGGGVATPSQEFTFDGGSGPLAFEPLNQAGSCFAVKGNVLDIANCDDNDANQKFTFGDAAAGGNGAGNDNSGDADTTTTSAEVAETTAAAQTSEAVETTAEVTETTAAETVAETAAATTSTSCTRRTRTVKVTAEATHATAEPATTAATSTAPSNDDFPVAGNPAVITDTTANGGQGIPNPTEAVPVSGAGGTLNPTAVAESHQRDDTATRAFESVEIRSPNGQCLFVDPTGGDFRENLIPITLVDCGGTPNEKWDVITAGKHNNADASAIIVSSLTQGCISFDGRRQAGDTVTIFSCGGRADGEGETNSGQLMPFLGELSFAFAPESEGNKTCILPDESLGRLSSGPCPTDGAQLFSIFP